jgi:hypothetical protein
VRVAADGGVAAATQQVAVLAKLPAILAREGAERAFFFF